MAGVLTAVLMRNVPGGGQEKIINYPEKIKKSGHTDTGVRSVRSGLQHCS